MFDTGIRPEELDGKRPRPVESPWGVFALYRVGDEVLAAQAFCPHLDGPLFEGSLRGDEIVCPWHQWRYSLRTGLRLGIGALLAPSAEDALLLADVHLSSAGTFVLSNPRRGPRRAR